MSHTYISLIKRMSRGGSLLILRKLVQMIFGLATFAILVRFLTREQFAIYTLTFTFIAIFRLSALPGLGNAVSQAFARGKQGGFQNAIHLSLLGSVAGAFLIAIAALWNMLQNNGALAEVLLVTALIFPALTGLLFWQHALIGQERYGQFLIFESISYALKCCGVITCAYMFPDKLYLVVMAALLIPAIVNILATTFLLNEVPEQADNEDGSVPYGIRTTIYQLPSVLATHLDKIILFYYISPEALAIYAVALRVPELARGLVFEANATLGPVFAKEKKYTKTLRGFTFKLWLTYLTVSVIGAVIFIPLLMPLLAGPEYPEATFYAQIMTIGVAFGYLGNIQFRYVKSQLDSQTFLKITLASSVVDITLIVTLTILFGFPGVIAAYIIKRLLHSLFIDIIMTRQYLRIPGQTVAQAR